MQRELTLLADKNEKFPDVSRALTEPDGLLAIGGDLSVERLHQAYSKAIFPWFNQHEPIMWWSPNPRAVIPTKNIVINKTLKKVIRRKQFTVTLNKAFNDVIAQCANAPFRKEGTWIVPEMINAYKRLHQHGHAHSIEVWFDGELVGGLYGVAINSFFSGESMFYKKSNASKIAVVALAHLFTSSRIDLIDCQLLNPFLADMGCIELDRTEFIKHQKQLVNQKVDSNFWQPRTLNITDE